MNLTNGKQEAGENGQAHFIFFVSPVDYSMVRSSLQSSQCCINIFAECSGFLRGRDYPKSRYRGVEMQRVLS